MDESDVKIKLNPNQNHRRVSISEIVQVIEVVDSEETISQEVPGIRKDLKKVMLLIYLYFLQGIPLGEHFQINTFRK